MSDDPREKFVIRARGLPWSATAKSVAKFFSGCNIRGGAKNGIHFTYSSEGSPTGKCFVELVSLEDMEKALAKSNNFLGKSSVEVVESKAGEIEWTCKRMGQPEDRGNEAVVRLRGLPLQVSKEEIAKFFKGLEIVSNGTTITLDEDGRTTGDAFVEFASPELALQAMKKNKEYIRHRKIMIFKSSKADIKYVSKPKRKPLMTTRPGPYDGRRFSGQGGDDTGYGGRHRGSGHGGRGGRGMGGRGGFRNQGRSGSGGNFGSMCSTGHIVHMQGLPFAAEESDVKQFFMPLKPVKIWMEYSGGSLSRQVNVDFASHEEAQAAMLKNKQSMDHRYIELFLCSQPDMEDVSGIGWAASERGGQNFGIGDSGGNNFGSENCQRGNVIVEDNSRNFGGAGSSFGGQANQSSGFNSPQPQQQQQQSNSRNQMGEGGGGGSFGSQGNSFSSNAGAFSASPSHSGGNYSAQSSYGQTNGLSGSRFGGQRSSGLSTEMTTGHYKASITVSTHVQPVITVWCIII